MHTRPTIVFVALATAFPLCTAALGREAEKHEARQATGVVLEIKPTRLILQTTDGRQMALTSFEDYTEELSPGAKVTAAYYPQDTGENVLKSLDYPAENFFVPEEAIRGSIHKIIILPDSEVPDADELYDGIRAHLHAGLGWYVAPAYLAAEIHHQAERAGSTLDAVDPVTGRFDLARYLSKTQGLIPRVASQARVDAVLEVDVKQVQATVTRLVASWDGAQEGLAGPGMRTLAKFSLFSKKGEVPAATVILKLWDSQGKLLWRDRHGLALLEVLEGRGNRLRERPLSEYLGDSQNLRDWLTAAFRSLAPGEEPRQEKGLAERTPPR